MTQYNFTTNIEKRMPTTGEVFYVDRMTSDYAQAHPFDVDAFLESVFQKWQDCETIGFRETREALRRQWDATLGERNPRGNAALYPNKIGEKHPALMEVWHKAGDYWRRGLRLGDVLPAVVPPCKITRTEDGWIALFPKDMHMLEQQADQPAKPETKTAAPIEPTEPAEQEQPEVCPAVFPQEEEEEAPTPSPLAQMQAELEALRRENEELRMKNEEFATAQRLQAEREAARREAEVQQHQREQEQEQEQRRREEELQAMTERELQRQLHRSHDIAPESNQHPTDEPAQPATARRKTTGRRWLKPLAVAAASVVACVVIYETGLLIPMGLIGLAMSGLVK